MIFSILEILIGILLIVSIILQNQGGGLSQTFGAAGEFYRSKRSLEKILIWITGGLIFLFALVSVILLLQK